MTKNELQTQKRPKLSEETFKSKWTKDGRNTQNINENQRSIQRKSSIDNKI